MDIPSEGSKFDSAKRVPATVGSVVTKATMLARVNVAGLTRCLKAKFFIRKKLEENLKQCNPRRHEEDDVTVSRVATEVRKWLLNPAA